MSTQQIKDVIWSRWLSTGSPAKAINAAADELARLFDEERSKAERRGAAKALREAARIPHNGADDFNGPRGRVHPQSLYNEGASPWLDGMADAIENGADL